MNNPFKNKFVVNLHHADFDGAVSGSCVKSCLGESVISKSVAIAKAESEIRKIINDVDVILLTDLGLYPDDKNNDLIDKIKDNKIIIYDHHINSASENMFANLPKTSVSVLENDICGATLTWIKMIEYFPSNSFLYELEDIVYLSDVYDMWRIDNKDFEYAVKINDLLDYQIGYNPDQFRDRWLKNPNPFKLTKKEHKIIDTKQIRGERNLKELEENAIIFEYKNIIVVLSEASSPTDFIKMKFMNYILDEENVDMFIFKYPNTTQCSVRIPSASSISDLNDWYNDFGCKGHSHAGGIPVNEYPKLEKILKTI